LHSREREAIRKHLVIIGIIMLLVSVGLSGCTAPASDKDKFIGSWSGTYSYGVNVSRKVPANITFFSDGTYGAYLPMITDNGRWDIKDGKLEKTTDGNPTVVYSYSFSKNGTILLLTSIPPNEQWNLTKQ